MAKDQATKERLQYRDQLNKAGDKYAAFRERQSTNGFYTKAQIKDQRRSYVENHVWLFDVYFKGYTTDSQYLRFVDLSDNAQRLVRAGAQIFPDSAVGKMFGGPNDVALRQFRAKGKEKDRTREIDLQARVLRAHEERQSGEELSEDRIYEKNAPQARKNDESAGLKDGQIKGIREVCAWMYQNTKKHQKFVENIAGRPLMERLLIFYIVEHKDAVQHNMSVADAQRAKRSYTPNRQNFENQLLFRKHWYKVTKNYNWDLVSDAANIASQMLHVMDKNNPVKKAQIMDESEDEEKSEDSKSEVNIISTSNKVMREKDDSEDGEESVIGEESESDEIFELVDKYNNKIKEKADIVLGDVSKSKKISKNSLQLIEGIEKDIDELQQIVTQKQGPAPKAQKSTMDHLNAGKPHFDKTSKYLSMVIGYVGLESTSIKILTNQKSAIGKIYSALYGDQFNLGKTIINDVSLGLDPLSLVLNTLSTIVNVTNLWKSFSITRGTDNALKISGAFASAGSLFKTGWSVSMDVSKAIGTGWGTSAGAITTGAVAGVAIGSVTALNGLLTLINTSSRKSELKSVEDDLNGRNRLIMDDEGMMSKGKRQILKNITAQTRRQMNRTEASSAMQMVSGALTAASGAVGLITPLTLGVSGFLALGLSGLALIVNAANAGYQSGAKEAETIRVVDEYLGMGGLLADYKAKNRIRNANKKKDFELRAKIREDAISLLGFPTITKMFLSIMWLYAQVIYEGAFKSPKNSEERGICRRIIRSLSFNIVDGADPKPGVAAIFGKLKA